MAETQSRPFIVVSGLPGSGKTTVGKHLAAALDLPLLDKDEILEGLFETKGTGDKIWRRALSRESDAVLQREAAASHGAVLVSFWHLSGMPEEAGTSTGWLSDLSDCVVGIRCVCPPDIAAQRFLQRRRHPGHLDSEASYAHVLKSFEDHTRLGVLQIEPSIEVDSSGTFNGEMVVRETRAAFTRCLTSACSRRRPMEL